MRGRTNYGVKLDYYHRIVLKIILEHQNPVTGLFPAGADNSHAWIRDNVYTILSVWGLSMAYKKMADMDEDRAKTYELEQSCVKLMRGLLTSMMQQKDKVEKFKNTQNPIDAVHAKFSSKTGLPVVGDSEWGHLQIDAVSLYLLILAQMTAAGLQIIFNLDEVAFIQNLVFYIESAYCIPDYGIWERGDKANHGLPELNASSIGMAKAALDAMNELDLFGARGGPSSVIHVLTDEAQKCQAVLQSMLPRESSSKEVDSGLLAIISYPAFAVDDPALIDATRTAIVSKLKGNYGCKRFLRDGYKTPKEDPNRLHYEPWELQVFENIECEWPLFFCYLLIDSIFNKDEEATAEYDRALEKLIVKTEDGIELVPEMYAVSSHNVNERIRVGKSPFFWAQSLYILGKLLQGGFIAAGELDPLNRRLCSEKKPDIVVQVVLLAEDEDMKAKLKEQDIEVQTVQEVAPIEVQPARVLSHLYTYLGRNEKLKLSGRFSRDVGILSTSKLYSLHDRIFAFTPQLTDQTRYYIASDKDLMIDIFKSEINFLKSSWKNILGRPVLILTVKALYLGRPSVVQRPHVFDLDRRRPTFIRDKKKPWCTDIDEYYMRNDVSLLVSHIKMDINFLAMQWAVLGRPVYLIILSRKFEDQGKIPLPMITTMKKLRSGYINGTRVTLGNLNDFLSTSCITNLSFLGCQEIGLPERLNPEVQKYLESQLEKSLNLRIDLLPTRAPNRHRPSLRRRMSVKGAIKKTRAIIGPESDGSQASDERRSSASGLSSGDGFPRSPSPEEKTVWKQTVSRHRLASEAQYADTEVEELLTMLRESDQLEEQGDILQYLIDTQGMEFQTGTSEDGSPITLKDLLKILYGKACQQKLWGLVRHTGGILGKRVEDLAKAVTDLLVRQKQVTVGMPPLNEHTITAPLPENELRQLIHLAYGDDESTAMLSQELLVYLAMFIRTEPQLFKEMLRLRIGLIIQVMATELSRNLNCSGEEASEHLLNLSPFEMKNLLHHIMSGKEFAISSASAAGHGNFSIISSKSRVSKKSQIGTILASPEMDISITDGDRQGQWLRRRRLDGALNRVPRDLYPRVWAVLERCEGIAIEGRVLHSNLTREMTSGELKFALEVESVLNTIPQPEYRQLVVEALMVLTLITEHNVVSNLGGIIPVENLVHKANQIFLDEQMKVDGDATLCCAKGGELPSGGLVCGGAGFICQHFYDSAPSGSFGTMTYIMKAVLVLLDCIPNHGSIECNLS